MGSNKSKPRKSNNQKHLPKVGTPANKQWEHDGQMNDAFGSNRVWAIVVGILVVMAIVGLILITI